jgi:hypothetical protein
MELARYYQSRRNRRGLSMVTAMVLAGLTAFAVYDGVAASPKAAADAQTKSAAATVEELGNTGLKRVVLIPAAAKRLDIKTAPVSDALVKGERRSVIPYAAVLYDSNGDTWTYTSPKPLVFVRHDIRVDDIRGGLAFLSKGPRPGTAVVTVGSAELWGIEYGGIEED